jgi:hypothetical protein
MHGWPMIVSHHLDNRVEFEELAKKLQIGRDYPMDVSPRKKRGAETKLLRYLDILIFKLNDCRENLIYREAKKWDRAEINQRMGELWSEYPDPPPGDEIVKILLKLSGCPPLTKGTAKQWAREIVVPVIMVEDAGDKDTCKIAALKSIWRHRGVKSRATFRSHLLSAVSSTLQRFARPD